MLHIVFFPVGKLRPQGSRLSSRRRTGKAVPVPRYGNGAYVLHHLVGRQAMVRFHGLRTKCHDPRNRRIENPRSLASWGSSLNQVVRSRSRPTQRRRSCELLAGKASRCLLRTGFPKSADRRLRPRPARAEVHKAVKCSVPGPKGALGDNRWLRNPPSRHDSVLAGFDDPGRVLSDVSFTKETSLHNGSLRILEAASNQELVLGKPPHLRVIDTYQAQLAIRPDNDDLGGITFTGRTVSACGKRLTQALGISPFGDWRPLIQCSPRPQQSAWVDLYGFGLF